MAYKKAFTPTSPRLRRVKATNPAFTIVELLVVIVVIGVLAAITVVSYSGITNRAVIANAQSDLSNASKKLKIYQLNNEDEDYPIDEATAIAAKLIPDDTNYSYYVDNTTNPKTFCISYINQDSNIAYSINQDGSPIPAPYCPVLYLDASNPNSYPGSGTTWYDLSGYGNDGELLNGVSYSNSNEGVLNFDGIDDYVKLPNDIVAVSDIRQLGVTYAAWVKTSDNSLQQRIGGQKTTTGYSDLASGGLGIINGKAAMVAYDDGIAYKYATGSTALSNNVWYYVVGTYSITDRNMRIYVNSLVEGSPVSIVTFNRLLTNTSNTIGKHDHSNPYQFNGQIPNFSIYKRSLSGAEIIQNFNALKGRYGL